MLDALGRLQTYSKPVGNSSVHRAKFLDALVKHVPKDISHFGKRLKSLTDLAEGSRHKLRLEFEDGSIHDTDVVLGCDGIHSKVRGYLDQESAGEAAQEGAATLQWSGSWAYRGAFANGSTSKWGSMLLMISFCMRCRSDSHGQVQKGNWGPDGRSLCRDTTDVPGKEHSHSHLSNRQVRDGKCSGLYNGSQPVAKEAE